MPFFIMETLYRHPDLILKHSAGRGIGVFTKTALKAKTILLVEHVVEGSITALRVFLTGEPDLLVALHPRDAIPSDTQSFQSLIVEKLIANATKDPDNDVYALGRNFNFFNHSCEGNALYAMPEDVSLKGNKFRFIFVALTQDVPVDAEVTVTYGAHLGHQKDCSWTCPCSKTLAEREKRLADMDEWRKANGLDAVASEHLRGYYGTLNEILNTYRQNMTFGDWMMANYRTPFYKGSIRPPPFDELVARKNAIFRALARKVKPSLLQKASGIAKTPDAEGRSERDFIIAAQVLQKEMEAREIDWVEGSSQRCI